MVNSPREAGGTEINGLRWERSLVLSVVMSRLTVSDCRSSETRTRCKQLSLMPELKPAHTKEKAPISDTAERG